MSQQMPNLAPKPESDEVRTTFERVDNRWDIEHASRDWMIIAALVVIYLVWMGTVYFFEPGIR